MTQPFRIRATENDGLVQALVLMLHPMETGLRKDASGAFVPSHYITEVRATVDGRTVFEARLSTSVAKDPLLSFRFRGARRGNRLRVTWSDTQGVSNSHEVLIT